MACAGQDIAAAPIDLAIERIRAVYRSWNRDTSVAQMRGDWDAAFGGCTIPVSRQRVSAGHLKDGEVIVQVDPPAGIRFPQRHADYFNVELAGELLNKVQPAQKRITAQLFLSAVGNHLHIDQARAVGDTDCGISRGGCP